ncbi:MAG TPA: TldD/PmbA family protein [Oligoflexus sp.]|uniref:TldD/PmbA family protein n=1 Tax=Oligoflexus sp. TaxID=1971216 RepID=UPI002D4A4D4A|nr:TldD/PmbA family protein [Oligoflexus sp.]HYX37968.1 TldD/PmbA family protein [Oligoflexus sp.]
MLDVQIAQELIQQGLSFGADFVDIYVEQTVHSVIAIKDQKVKDIKTGTDFGIGIRALFGDKSVYGYTNIAERAELLRILGLICGLDQKSGSGRAQALKLQRTPDRQPAKQGLDRDAGYEEKIAWLMKIDEYARKNPKIVQMDIGSLQKWQTVQVFDSDGMAMEDQRHYTRLPLTAIAADGSKQARAFHGPGGGSGWELTQGWEPEEMADLLVKRALTVLHADPCPAGKMPVIIDNGFGGVIFHEACGHLLETTSVEKKASVFHDKMGEMIAHEAVSAVDDGTLPGLWGSLNMDDEGMPTQKTQLIKNGRLEAFLVDRLGHMKTGHARTGSGRRQSYKFAPASRMRNTYIEAGPHRLEAMLSTVKEGLFAKVMGGGSVTPGTGDFNFAVEEAYLIKNGKIDRPVRGATLIGSGPEVLRKISMVGQNLELSPGMCGSVSGSIPVTVGQPSLKVDEILVGGEA